MGRSKGRSLSVSKSYPTINTGELVKPMGINLDMPKLYPTINTEELVKPMGINLDMPKLYPTINTGELIKPIRTCLGVSKLFSTIDTEELVKPITTSLGMSNLFSTINTPGIVKAVESLGTSLDRLNVIDSTKLLGISKTLSNTLPYKSFELSVNHSISLEKPYFIDDTKKLFNHFLNAKEVSENTIIHNTSSILDFNSIPLDYNLSKISSIALGLKKFVDSMFLIDTSLINCNDEKLVKNYITSKVDYIHSSKICEYINNDKRIISISANGTEIIDDNTNESILVEDISLVDDVFGLNNITIKEIREFYRFVYKFPMLAMDDDCGIGKKIYGLIKANYDKNLIIEDKLVLYRARRYEEKDKLPFTENEVYLAPYGVSRRGRFNSPEMNHLYLSTDLQATLRELGAKQQDKFAILSCEPKHPLNLFDLTKGKYALQDFCMQSIMDSTGREYIIPNFFSNCCRRAGYEGIKYKSVKDETQINYVLFEHDMGNFNTIDFGDYIINKVSVDIIDYEKL